MDNKIKGRKSQDIEQMRKIESMSLVDFMLVISVREPLARVTPFGDLIVSKLDKE